MKEHVVNVCDGTLLRTFGSVAGHFYPNLGTCVGSNGDSFAIGYGVVRKRQPRVQGHTPCQSNKLNTNDVQMPIFDDNQRSTLVES